MADSGNMHQLILPAILVAVTVTVFVTDPRVVTAAKVDAGFNNEFTEVSVARVPTVPILAVTVPVIAGIEVTTALVESVLDADVQDRPSDPLTGTVPEIETGFVIEVTDPTFVTAAKVLAGLSKVLTEVFKVVSDESAAAPVGNGKDAALIA